MGRYTHCFRLHTNLHRLLRYYAPCPIQTSSQLSLLYYLDEAGSAVRNCREICVNAPLYQTRQILNRKILFPQDISGGHGRETPNSIGWFLAPGLCDNFLPIENNSGPNPGHDEAVSRTPDKERNPFRSELFVMCSTLKLAVPPNNCDVRAGLFYRRRASAKHLNYHVCGG